MHLVGCCSVEPRQLGCPAEDQGIQFSADERRAAVQQLQQEIYGGPQAVGEEAGSESDGSGSGSSDEEEHGQEEGGAAARLAAVAEQMSWRERDKTGYDAAAVASGRWGRVIRPPRRRGRHVILDVCAATVAGCGAGEAGQLERHVVAKSDERKGVGNAGYRIAQKAGWGDLWPAPYMPATRKEVLSSAGKGQQQGGAE
jgi:hypothetical protein